MEFNEEKFLEYIMSYISGDTSEVSVVLNSNNNNKSFNHLTSQISASIIKDVNKKVLKIFWNKEKMDKFYKFWDLVDNGVLYFHDQDKMMLPYCFATSTSILSLLGRPYGQLKSLPPKRSDSFISQVIEYTMDLSQEFAGAIALGDIFLEYSKFLIKEGISLDRLSDKKYKKEIYKKIENDFQKFIHVVNNSFRVSGDSPFTNVSLFDRYLLRETFNVNDENLLSVTVLVQKVFGEFFSKGDPLTGMPYRFPVCTVNIYTKDNKIHDEDFYNWFLSIGKNGGFNIYLTDDVGKLASCCRLVSDIKTMTKKLNIDSFGNGGVNIGSHRVVTLNLYKFIKMKEQYCLNMSMIDILSLCVEALCAHRLLIKHLIENNFLKFFKPLGWINLDKMFFSTIGFIGLFESSDGIKENMINILGEMRDSIDILSEEHKIPINFEQIPGESAAVKLANGTPFNILSNQFLPLWYDFDIMDRILIAGELDSIITGGGITHINIGDKITKRQFDKIIKCCISNKVRHFAINPVFSLCIRKHVSMGKFSFCPICDCEISDYVTRIVGYFTPVTSWNAGRKEEFKERFWRT